MGRRKRKKKRHTGMYRGKKFRSMWEYSFYKHLESEGVSWDDIVYEPFGIPYRVLRKPHVYHPDFLIRGQDRLVEVKSSYGLTKRRGSRVLREKFKAAEAYCSEHGLRFEVVTEADFKVFSFARAVLDPEVVWD